MKKVWIFLGTLVLTCVLGQNEFLRGIPGKSFIGLWLLFAVVLAGAAVGIMAAIAAYRRNSFADRWKETTVNHTDMPHMYMGLLSGLKGRNSSVPAVVRYYYMLRLYLRGIVTYKWERGSARLYISETTLEQVKAEGGRHSAVAAHIVENIRKRPGHSFAVALTPGWAEVVEEHDVFKQQRGLATSLAEMTSTVMAVVMGVAWGTLLAKFVLGVANRKPVGLLILVMIFGVILSALVNIFGSERKSKCSYVDGEWVVSRLKKNPHELNQELLEKANRTLPTEAERHQILNGYFVSPSLLLTLAKRMEKTTFLHQFALYVDKQTEIAIKKYQESVKEEEARKATKAKSDSSSGCTSCGSCSSCSSCSSCGGCGGCGD